MNSLNMALPRGYPSSVPKHVDQFTNIRMLDTTEPTIFVEPNATIHQFLEGVLVKYRELKKRYPTTYPGAQVAEL